MSEAAINKLKLELGVQLRTPEQVVPSLGLATGWAPLDRYLLWHGFPKSAVSLMVSDAGGATSLWIRSIAGVTKSGQWAAWVGDGETDITPWMLRHRGVDLAKLLVVGPPKDGKQLLWALQELMSLCLFEAVACDLGSIRLREHQVLKLKRMAARYKTALVLITKDTRVQMSSFYSLILSFDRNQVTVHRALHRPSPFILERRDLYADTLPLLAAGRSALCG